MADENTSGESIEAAYASRRGQMVGMARKLLADEGIPDSKIGAEDVVQNAYLKALQKQRTTPIAQSGPYVRAVLRNQVRDEARRRDNATVSVPEYDTTVTVRHAHPDPAEQVHQRILLRSALARLSPSQRRMVWMTRGMGYTHAEAAWQAGIRASTASAHVLRGTLVLRTLFAGTLMLVGALCLKTLGLLDGTTELASTGRVRPVLVRAEDLAWGGLYTILLLAVGAILRHTLAARSRPLLTLLMLATQLLLAGCSLRLLVHTGAHSPGSPYAEAVLDWLNFPTGRDDNLKLLVGGTVFLYWLVQWRNK